MIYVTIDSKQDPWINFYSKDIEEDCEMMSNYDLNFKMCKDLYGDSVPNQIDYHHALHWLAKNNFIPVSETFFYKP